MPTQTQSCDHRAPPRSSLCTCTSATAREASPTRRDPCKLTIRSKPTGIPATEQLVLAQCGVLGESCLKSVPLSAFAGILRLLGRLLPPPPNRAESPPDRSFVDPPKRILAKEWRATSCTHAAGFCGLDRPAPTRKTTIPSAPRGDGSGFALGSGRDRF